MSYFGWAFHSRPLGGNDFGGRAFSYISDIQYEQLTYGYTTEGGLGMIFGI